MKRKKKKGVIANRDLICRQIGTDRRSLDAYKSSATGNYVTRRITVALVLRHHRKAQGIKKKKKNEESNKCRRFFSITTFVCTTLTLTRLMMI